ncbi:outer membrane protein assembly factor BamD [Marinobacter confluentis]|uniref:Outer membrane protein assembly factor BamD n=1 Tax=Marinobacter confluentis TaxID=1697557 RepID=A0A4Z1C7E1_9GAMM|nr:tetratricopeptide repeat protein [Marinobacter confluentis]TGN41550.1 outer membrane protein assembly factor BamD [Marinobacter confluentis]
MSRLNDSSWHLILTLITGLLAVNVALGQESFRVELGRDGETIGDMRPVFLEFKTQPMPAISPVEVARRYQKLFDNADEPDVRIDALARLSNIQRLTDQNIAISQDEEQRIYREAISSYEAILNKGSYYGKLDELIYQMAKAHAFVGQMEESTARLKQLVGLYPGSELVPEARFRIAESAFSRGRYAEAEAEYSRLISGDGGDSLKTKARYMLGWSQYKQGPAAWRRAAVTFLTVLDGLSGQTSGFTRVPRSDAELVEDTFRVIALMAAEARGIESIAEWSDDAERTDAKEGVTAGFSDLLYDRLADLYASRGQYTNSVAVHRAFIARHSTHPGVPAFYAQSVQVWRMAGQNNRVREARADYVAAFSKQDRYTALNRADQQRWLEYAKTLGDYHYDQGETASRAERKARFTSAANYYSQLATRQDSPGETLRLAGDAWLQAGEARSALAAFRQAAYQAPGYPDADDAGWAALVLERDAVDGRNSLGTSLGQLADASEKWSARFPDDPRIPELSSDLANRLLAQSEHERARQFAEMAINHPEATPAVTYSALLALGETQVLGENYRLAENAWRKALGLMTSGQVTGVAPKEAMGLKRQLATSIYRQGEQAAAEARTDIAVAHFQRIDSVLPGSDIAIKGRFDAANTLLKAERWLAAVNELSRFRQDYPAHPLTASVSEKLVLAYVSSQQPVRAADELMAASPLMEKQLRAAELYHQAGAEDKRNKIYLSYLGQGDAAIKPTDARAHVMNQTFRQRLIESDVSATALREQLVTAELESDWHSPETLNWAGQAALQLGDIQANRFAAVELRAPLADSLARKQRLLDAAGNRYDQARTFGGQGVVSRATFEKAELFRRLAADLMASEAPPELNEMETMQYQMLLEEEAYPFEERAITLHERNHQRLAEGVFDQWVEQSLQVLAELFPGRYARSVRWMSLSEKPSEESDDDA